MPGAVKGASSIYYLHNNQRGIDYTIVVEMYDTGRSNSNNPIHKAKSVCHVKSSWLKNSRFRTAQIALYF